MTVRDLKGNVLKLILLQVMDRHADGMPLVLHVRREDERIDLTATTPNVPTPQFLMVWVPADSGLSETSVSALVAELDAVKELQASAEQLRAQLTIDLNTVTREVQALIEENYTKTEALRVLQKERDPEHVARLVKEQTDKATEKLTTELVAARAQLSGLTSELTEAKVAKKRLREALERLKK